MMMMIKLEIFWVVLVKYYLKIPALLRYINPILLISNEMITDQP